MKSSLAMKGALIAALIALMVGLSQVVDLTAFFYPSRIQEILAMAGVFAPLLYMALMALAVVIAIIPSFPLNVAAGAFFGPLAGTLYSVLGATGGAVASFFIARFLGREFMERILTGHINFCTQCSDKLLTKVIFLSRLLPFVSFDIVSYGAGLTKMSVRAFALATVFGALPLTFIYNYFGAALVMSRSLALFFGLLLVAAVFVLPRLIERYDLFSLRQFFRHEEAPLPSDKEKGEGLKV
jgi:uncharacterized membrane protein YdjX (TVP38/TMEM64 family)